MRNKEPLKQILQQTRWYWDHDGFRPDVRASFRNALLCRTPALGAEVFASEKRELIVYHTCKSRACPSCGHWGTMKWQHERLVALPPVPYKGITFTMPNVLWQLFGDNRSLADALPVLAAGAIEALIPWSARVADWRRRYSSYVQWSFGVQLARARDGHCGRLALIIRLMVS